MLRKLVIVYAITAPPNSGAVFLVTTWLLFPLNWKHMPHRRLQILKMMLLYIYTYEYTRTEYT